MTYKLRNKSCNDGTLKSPVVQSTQNQYSVWGRWVLIKLGDCQILNSILRRRSLEVRFLTIYMFRIHRHKVYKLAMPKIWGQKY